MKKLSFAALAASALLWSATAGAGTFLLDSFDTHDMSVSDIFGGASTCQANAARQICHDFFASVPPRESTVQVTQGVLDINNGTGDNSTVTVNWALNLANPVTIFNLAVNILADTSDTRKIEFFYKPTTTGNFTSLGAMTNTTGFSAGILQTSFAPLTIAAGNNGAIMRMVLTGVPGWDLTLDMVGANVPEPTTLALLSIGLLGLGARRRLRKNAEAG